MKEAVIRKYKTRVEIYCAVWLSALSLSLFLFLSIISYLLRNKIKFPIKKRNKRLLLYNIKLIHRCGVNIYNKIKLKSKNNYKKINEHTIFLILFKNSISMWLATFGQIRTQKYIAHWGKCSLIREVDCSTYNLYAAGNIPQFVSPRESLVSEFVKRSKEMSAIVERTSDDLSE